jgi:hypothetical protein
MQNFNEQDHVMFLNDFKKRVCSERVLHHTQL